MIAKPDAAHQLETITITPDELNKYGLGSLKKEGSSCSVNLNVCSVCGTKNERPIDENADCGHRGYPIGMSERDAKYCMDCVELYEINEFNNRSAVTGPALLRYAF